MFEIEVSLIEKACFLISRVQFEFRDMLSYVFLSFRESSLKLLMYVRTCDHISYGISYPIEQL